MQQHNRLIVTAIGSRSRTWQKGARHDQSWISQTTIALAGTGLLVAPFGQSVPALAVVGVNSASDGVMISHPREAAVAIERAALVQ